MYPLDQSHKSHNAPVLYPTMHNVYSSVPKCCIVLWDMVQVNCRICKFGLFAFVATRSLPSNDGGELFETVYMEEGKPITLFCPGAHRPTSPTYTFRWFQENIEDTEGGALVAYYKKLLKANG